MLFKSTLSRLTIDSTNKCKCFIVCLVLTHTLIKNLIRGSPIIFLPRLKKFNFWELTPKKMCTMWYGKHTYQIILVLLNYTISFLYSLIIFYVDLVFMFPSIWKSNKSHILILGHHISTNFCLVCSWTTPTERGSYLILPLFLEKNEKIVCRVSKSKFIA